MTVLSQSDREHVEKLPLLPFEANEAAVVWRSPCELAYNTKLIVNNGDLGSLPTRASCTIRIPVSRLQGFIDCGGYHASLEWAHSEFEATCVGRDRSFKQALGKTSFPMQASSYTRNTISLLDSLYICLPLLLESEASPADSCRGI